MIVIVNNIKKVDLIGQLTGLLRPINLHDKLMEKSSKITKM